MREAALQGGPPNATSPLQTLAVVSADRAPGGARLTPSLTTI